MTPKTDAATKKGELLQLRLEKSVLNQLNAFADEQGLPLSVMIRSWLSERLRSELAASNLAREVWLSDRFLNVRELVSTSFAAGPVLVVHGFPLSPGVSIDPPKIQSGGGNLAPLSRGLPTTGRINRMGYEAVCERQEKIVEKGQAYKTGQLENIFSIPLASEKEIYGLAFDDAIVTLLRCYVGVLAGLRINPPYLFKVSILNAKDYWLTIYKTIYSTVPHVAFQEDFFTLPDITINSFEQTNDDSRLAEHIKPTLDELWHASGLPGSASFTDDGNWRKRPIAGL